MTAKLINFVCVFLVLDILPSFLRGSLHNTSPMIFNSHLEHDGDCHATQRQPLNSSSGTAITCGLCKGLA